MVYNLSHRIEYSHNELVVHFSDITKISLDQFDAVIFNTENTHFTWKTLNKKKNWALSGNNFLSYNF